MSSCLATFCCLIAASAILYAEAETTVEKSDNPNHARNTSFVTTPALSNDIDVSPDTIDEEEDGSGAVSSLSSQAEAHTTTLFDFGEGVTVIVDDVTIGDDYDYVTVVDNVTPSPPSGNTTTRDSVTTLHAIDGTPSTSGLPSSAGTTSGSTSSVSFMQTNDNRSTMSPTDAMTDAYNETLDGATIHTTPVTIIDEPVATQSVDIADSDKDLRLQKNLGGALMPVFQMTSFFLERIVQTNYVTQLQLNVTDIADLRRTAGRAWSTWVVYLIGFVVCASVGLLLSILIPCVGLCVACCRCTGHCGAKIDPSDGRHAKCQRLGCGMALLVITAVLVAAVVCVFAMNERLRHQLRDDDNSSFDDVSRSIGDVEAYINGTTTEFRTQVVDRCSDHLDGLKVEAGQLPDRVVDAIGHATGVQSVLPVLRRVTDALRNITHDVLTAEQEMTSLRNQSQQLQTLLEDIKSNLRDVVANCTTTECNTTRERVDRLKVVGDFSETIFQRVWSVLDDARQEGLYNVTDVIEDEIDVIKTALNDSIAPSVASFREKTEETQTQLMIEVDEMLSFVDKVNLSSAARAVQDAKHRSQWPAYIVYCCLASLGLFVCFIILCNVIGLLYGTFSRRATLTSEGPCDADRSVGAVWLLAGVGLTFVFYAVLTTASLALFLAGGLAHTEVCRHLVDYNDDPRSAEVIRFLESSARSLTVDGWPTTVSYTSTYSRCRQDESFYAAADLETTLGLNAPQMIDLQTARELVDTIKDVSVVVPQVALLSPGLEALLRTPMHISEACDSLGADVTSVDLTELSRELKALAHFPRETAAAIADQLGIAETKVATIRETTGRLITLLRNADGLINASVEIFERLHNSQEMINTQGSEIASAFINRSAETIYEDMKILKADFEWRIRNDFGRCRPVYDAVTAAIDSTCIKVLYPLNGIWFCLGCCILLLLPSILLSFKLATLYRKLDSFDESPYEYADPIYDAYGPSDYHDFGDRPRDVLIQKLDTTRPRSYEPMGPVDNPVYMLDSEVELTGPPDNNRPRFFSPGYPVYAKPAVVNRVVNTGGRPSPPPSYQSSTIPETSYDTRL